MIHGGVSARFEHDRGAQIVVVLAQPFAAFQHRGPFGLGKAAHNESQGLAAGVGVERLNRHHDRCLSS